jgi:phosphatidylserine/phosphatidylglycerophosphate/cardiolipin synthase-like enzyme
VGLAFAAVAALAVVVVVVWSGIVALATPTVAYRLDRRFDLGSREFEDAMSSALATRIVGGNRITRLDDGARFYPEMLAAIAGAHRSIALECYIFHPGRIQAVFAENWLECRGDIMAGEEWFPSIEPCGTTDAAVVKNSLSFAGSRALFQALIECASHEIRLATPYFVPDPSFVSALIESAHRGVLITILLPGKRMDHPWVRLSSRRLFRPLLEAGIRLFEYQPSMTHQKLMIVDRLWTVVGTTNLDMMSFEYLDEINLAVRDETFARDAQTQHDADLAHSVEVRRSWHRSVWEKTLAWAVWTLAGQRWILRLRRRPRG